MVDQEKTLDTEHEKAMEFLEDSVLGRDLLGCITHVACPDSVSAEGAATEGSDKVVGHPVELYVFSISELEHICFLIRLFPI